MSPIKQIPLRACLLTAAIAATTSGQVNAQTAEIEEIVVEATGSRLSGATTTFPGSVTVIDNQELANQAAIAPDLGQILSFNVPGLGTTTSNTAQNYEQTLRGRKMAILVDGISVSIPLRNASRDLRALGISAIENVEVIRGASALYGNGGAGGVINYLTKQPQQDSDFSGSTQVSMGMSRGSDSLNPSIEQSLSGSVGGFDIMVNGSYESVGSFFDGQGDRISANPNRNGGKADSIISNFYGKVGYVISDDKRVEVSVLSYDQEQDTDWGLLTLGDQVLGIKNQPQKGQVDPRVVPEFNTSVMVQASYIQSDTVAGDLRFQVFSRDIDQQFSWNSGRQSQSRISSSSTGFRFDANTPFNLGGDTEASVLWGLEWVSDETDQSLNTTPRKVFVPAIEQDNTAFFAQVDLPINESLLLQGGIRYDKFDLSADSFNTVSTGLSVEGGSLSYNSTVYNIGLNYQINDTFSTFAAFSQGFSLPDIGRSLRQTSNPKTLSLLKPEPVKIDNYEIGFRGNWDTIQTTVSIFQSESELGQRFEALPDPNSNDFSVKRSPEEIYGIEATLSANFADDKGLVGGTFTKVEGKEGENLDSYIPNDRIPPVKVTGFIQYDLSDSWNIRAQAIYSGNRNRFSHLDHSQFNWAKGEIKSFWTADLVSAWNVWDGTLTLAASNLFDKYYYPIAGQKSSGLAIDHNPAPGRIIKLSFSIDY